VGTVISGLAAVMGKLCGFPGPRRRDAAVKPKFTVAAIWLTGPEQPNRLRGRGSVFMCGIAVAIDWPDAELTVRLLISGILHRGDVTDPVVTPR